MFSQEQLQAELQRQDEDQFFELHWEPVIPGSSQLRYKRRDHRPETRTRRVERSDKLKAQIKQTNDLALAAFEEMRDARPPLLNAAQILAGAVVVNEHHYACRHCQRLVTEHDDLYGTRDRMDKMFDCSQCKLWVHADCMGFGLHMYGRFADTESWLCKNCRPRKQQQQQQQPVDVDAANAVGDAANAAGANAAAAANDSDEDLMNMGRGLTG